MIVIKFSYDDNNDDKNDENEYDNAMGDKE